MAKESLTLKLLRWAMGGLFLFSGLSKLADPESFRSSLAAYELVPPGLQLQVVWFLPSLELVCGASLLLGRGQGGAILIILGLLVVFTLAIASAWFRGLDIRCGCFGSWFDGGGYPWWIFRNVLLLALMLRLNRQWKVSQAVDC